MTATTTTNRETELFETEDHQNSTSAWSEGLDRLASWRVWTASALVFFPLAFLLFASSATFAIPEVEALCGQAPPDMRFYSSGDDVIGFLDACGPTGRAAYTKMQLVDVLYPAVVGVFLASSLALVTRRLSARNSVHWIAALPLAAALFDYVENSFAWLAILSYPEAIVTSDVLGIASAAKTSTSWVAGLTLVACLVVVGCRSVRSTS